MKNNDINDIVNYILNNIKKRFSFLGLKNIDVLNVIKKQSFLVANYDFESFKKQLYDNVNNYYFDFLSLKIKKQKFEITDDFIDSFINENVENITKIENLILFLEKLNIDLTKEVYELIIKNKKINLLIQEIINSKKIKQGYLFELTDNFNVINIFEIYCSINGIRIIEEKTDKLSISRDSNNLKALDSLSCYMKDISKIPLLTSEEEYELALKIQNDNDASAKRKLIESNLRLVIFVAAKYTRLGLPFEDLIQEGNMGLIKAADKFDISKGCRFPTYAMYWIKKCIKESLTDKSRLIRIPRFKALELMDYRNKKEQLIKKQNNDLTFNDISDKLNIKLSEVIEYEKLLLDVCSINQQQSKDVEIPLVDMIADDSGVNVEDTVLKKIENEKLRCMLETLTDKEKIVIMCRYGFFDGEIISLSKTAVKLYENQLTDRVITREGVRLIEKKAIKKLKVKQLEN